jgi:molybdopterin converting factor small subunit
MARVHFSSGLRAYTGGVAEVDVSAPNVRRLIAALDQRFPGIGERLTSGTSVAINGDIIADAFLEPVPDDAEVHFVQTLAGG